MITLITKDEYKGFRLPPSNEVEIFVLLIDALWRSSEIWAQQSTSDGYAASIAGLLSYKDFLSVIRYENATDKDKWLDDPVRFSAV